MSNLTPQSVKLANEIRLAASKYYVESISLITDEEFDALVDQLREIQPAHPLLTTPGWGGEEFNINNKYPHWSKVVGLSEVKSHNATEFMKTSSWTVGLKYDGITGVAQYKDGKLLQVLTRGDGEVGKDITAVALATGSVPTQLEDTTSIGYVEVRGEFCMTFENHLKHSKLGNCKEDTHIRNIVSGQMMSHDETVMTPDIDFLVFSVKFREDGLQWNGFDGYNELFDMVADFGCGKFQLGQMTSYLNSSETIEYYETNKLNCSYPIDGLVITKLGEQFDPSDFQQWKVKFPADVVEATIGKIEFRKTATGRVIPHATFKEPVFTGGAWIRHCTLNNYDWICNNFEHQVWEGAVVGIRRANEVIPQIVSVITPSKRWIPSVDQIAELIGLRSEQVWVEGNDIKYFESQSYYEDATRRWVEIAGLEHGLGGSAVMEFIETAKELAKSELGYNVDTPNWLSLLLTSESDCSKLKGKLGNGPKKILANILANKALTTKQWMRILKIPQWGNSKQADVDTVWNLNMSTESKEVQVMYFRDRIKGIPADRERTDTTTFMVSCLSQFLDFKIDTSDEEEKSPEPSDAVRFSMTGKINGMKKDEYAASVSSWAVWDDKDYQIMVTDSERESSKMKKAKDNGKEILSSEAFLQVEHL